jgi:hypothetical protein
VEVACVVDWWRGQDLFGFLSTITLDRRFVLARFAFTSDHLVAGFAEVFVEHFVHLGWLLFYLVRQEKDESVNSVGILLQINSVS